VTEGETVAAESAAAGADDITAEIPVATEEVAASDEVALSEEGTVEAETLAGDQNEVQPEASGEQPEPEAESASKTTEQ